MQTLTGSLLTLLHFGQSQLSTPLSHTTSQRQSVYRKLLDSFRKMCVQTPFQKKISSLDSFIHLLQSHQDHPSSSVDPLSYDAFNIPTVLRPQLSLKRSSSSTSAQSTSAKKKTRLIVAAIDKIMNALGTLKTDLEKEDNGDE